MSKEGVKVLFTEKELSLIKDSSFLKTKQVVTRKVHKLLIATEEKLKVLIQSGEVKLPETVLIKTGKISKGEKYLDLPYLVLDYPRYFSNETIFTYRTMFWWGNFLTCTLHLQGEMLAAYKKKLLYNLSRNQDEDIYFCINENPWEYHYERSNYIPLTEVSEVELSHFLNRRKFIKLSRKLSFNESHHLPAFASETFKLFYKQIREERY